MSVAASSTIKTNPVLTLGLNAQMSTGQWRRTMEGLKRSRRHGIRRTSRRWDAGRDGATVGRRDGRARGAGYCSVAVAVVIVDAFLV